MSINLSLTHQIITGDVLAVLPMIPDGAVALTFADPPYNIGIDYGGGKQADRRSDFDYLTWCAKWIAECVRALRPGGTMWVLINDEYADSFGVMLRRAGLTRRNWIVWYETFGVNCKSKFNRTKRHLFYCVKGKAHTFNREAVTRPSARQAKYNDPRANPNGKCWDDVWQIPRLAGTHKERLPDFPTQLPMSLLNPIVTATSNPGDLVLDPFNGSGTTGAVALTHGRRYIGIELNETYAEAARERMGAICPQ